MHRCNIWYSSDFIVKDHSTMHALANWYILIFFFEKRGLIMFSYRDIYPMQEEWLVQLVHKSIAMHEFLETWL